MANSSTTRDEPAQSARVETTGYGADAPESKDAPIPVIPPPEAPPLETAAPPPPVKLRPIDLIESAKRQLKELTGYPVDSVAGFAKNGDGWALTVTVIELTRIPAAADVLAEYVVDIDAAGDVVGYRRGRRFHRGDVGSPE